MHIGLPWFAAAIAAVASATAATAATKGAECPAVGAFERTCLSGEPSVLVVDVGGKIAALLNSYELAGGIGSAESSSRGEIFYTFSSV